MLLTAFISILGYVGIFFNYTPAKILSAITQVFIFLLSIRIIYNASNQINWKKSFLILAVLCFYPLIRIILETIQLLNFKNFTDAVIILGGYYQIVLAGFAIAILTKDGGGFQAIYRFSYFALPIGLILILISFNFIEESPVGFGLIVITNCLIPLSFLTYENKKKINILIGWLAILAIFFISSAIFLRSYVIIGFLLAFFSIKTTLTSERKRVAYATLVIIALAYYLNLFSFMSESSIIKEKSIFEKFQFNSFGFSISNFLVTGNIDHLFYWEGNSRNQILLDAFSDFNQQEWLYGKGVFATYKSFVIRSTIEIGWAQEIFRFGLVYVILVIVISIFGYFFITKHKYISEDLVYKILTSIILIKIIDSFIYGVPQTNVYNLIFFWGIMIQGLKQNSIVKYKI